jgi:hypothetical protein
VTNDGLRNVWREVVVAYFKAVSQKFVGNTEEYHANLSLECQALDIDLLECSTWRWSDLKRHDTACFRLGGASYISSSLLE